MNNQHSPQAIARRVREARKATGLSQEGLAPKLGLSKVAYGDYERVSRLFDTEQLFQLERILGQPVTWLLGIETKFGELTNEEQQLLGLWRKAKEQSEDFANVVLRTISAMVENDRTA